MYIHDFFIFIGTFSYFFTFKLIVQKILDKTYKLCYFTKLNFDIVAQRCVAMQMRRAPLHCSEEGQMAKHKPKKAELVIFCSQNGCNRHGEVNLPVNPETVTVSELKMAALCKKHGYNHGTYPLAMTIASAVRSAGSGEEWAARQPYTPQLVIEAKPRITFTCNHEGCEEVATCNSPVNPATITVGELHQLTFCNHHGGNATYPIGLTVRRATEVGGWEEWLARQRAPQVEVKRVHRYNFTCSEPDCAEDATRNLGVDTATFTLEGLTTMVLCDAHAIGQKTFPLPLTLASGRDQEGSWEALEARVPRRLTVVKDMNPFGAPPQAEAAKKTSASQAARLAKKRAKSAAAAAALPKPNVGSGDIAELGFGRGNKAAQKHQGDKRRKA